MLADYHASKSQRANARLRKYVTLVAGLVLALLSIASSCKHQSNAFVIALSDNVKTIDPIGSPSVDAASERVRSLMFNSLVKKDEKFDMFRNSLPGLIDPKTD